MARPKMMGSRELARWWVRGLVDPAAAMRALPDAGWPKAGMVAVVTRFTVQDPTSLGGDDPHARCARWPLARLSLR